MIEAGRKYFLMIAVLCATQLFVSEAKTQESVDKKLPAEMVTAGADETKIEIAYASGKLTMDLKNAEIKDVLTKIGQTINVQVEIGDGISGRVTGSIQDRSLEEGLSVLIRGEGTGIVVGYDRDGTVKLIKMSKKTADWPEKVIAVKKVRSFFSPAELASSISLDQVKELVANLEDQGKNRQWGMLAKDIIKIRIREAKPYLKRLMNHGEDYIRWEATDAFCRLVDIEDADFVLEMAQDEDWNRRAVAAYTAMPLINDPRQIKILIAMLKDPKGSVQEGALEALSCKRSKEAIPALEELLKNGKGSDKPAAARALYEITGIEREWKTPEEKRHDAIDMLVGDKVQIEAYRGLVTSEYQRKKDQFYEINKKRHIQELHLTTEEEINDFEIRLQKAIDDAAGRIKSYKQQLLDKQQ